MAPTQGFERTRGWNSEAVGQIVTLKLQIATCHHSSWSPEQLLSMKRAAETWEPQKIGLTSNPRMLLKTTMKLETNYNLLFSVCSSPSEVAEQFCANSCRWKLEEALWCLFHPYWDCKHHTLILICKMGIMCTYSLQKSVGRLRGGNRDSSTLC